MKTTELLFVIFSCLLLVGCFANEDEEFEGDFDYFQMQQEKRAAQGKANWRTQTTQPFHEKVQQSTPPQHDETQPGSSENKKSEEEKFQDGFSRKTFTERFLDSPGDYAMELSYIGLIVIYGLFYLNGKSQNHDILKEWASLTRNILSKKFSEVSYCYAESCSSGHMIAKGLPGCIGAKIFFSLKRRHDVYSFFTSFITPSKDVMTIDVPMVDMEKMIFALVRSHDEKQLRTDMADLEELPKRADDGRFAIISETSEPVDKLLTQEFVSLLKKFPQFFQLVYFSDSNKLYPHEKALKFVFNLPTVKEKQNFEAVLKLALNLIELVSRFKYSKLAKDKIEAKRAKVELAKIKEVTAEKKEAQQKKKQEKLEKFKAQKEKQRGLTRK